MGNNLVLRLRLAMLLIIALCRVPTQAAEPAEWPTLALTEIVPRRFTSPTAIAHAGDGSQRLFIAERSGRIWIANNGEVLPEPFLDLSSQVATTGPEQGLLGLAFPPNFEHTQRFYVFYTAERTPPFQNLQRSVVISRFQVSFDPNRASLRSEEVLLRLEADADFHNGGQLAFGPDGLLYIGVGDSGPLYNTGHRAQNLTSHFGKILRIDVESQPEGYTIPRTNPFRGRDDAHAEIWAYGLRNPWRFSFDRANGDLYIGDVGQGHFEEVNYQPASSSGGQNYGWRILEGLRHNNVPPGFTAFDTLTSPILTYDHAPLGGDGGQGSVTGGYVYRGPNPGRLAGMYIYGDFMAGYIWGLRRENDQWQTNALRTPFDSPLIMMSTFGEDEAGRLYMADYNRGIIYQLSDSGQAWTPEFTPREGAIPDDQLLITSQTPNATIRYTTDGSEPNESSPLVPTNGRVTIQNGATVKAQAFRDGLAPSAIRSAAFQFRIGAPIISPGDYQTAPLNSLVTIRSETPNATILYSTNGEWPPNDRLLTYSNPLVLTSDMTVLAKAVAPGFGESAVVGANIFVRKTARPRFDPNVNWVTAGTPVSINCETPNAAIFYQITSAGGTSQWQRYTTPLIINSRTTISAYAESDGNARSEYANADFYLLIAPPVFDPPTGTKFANQFTLSCATPGATIFYTFDQYGQWTRYSGPVTLTDSTQVYARAYSAFGEASLEQSIYYEWPRVGFPLFDPPVGPVTNGTLITIRSMVGEPGAVIRYTLDGTEPTAQSPIYTEPLRINPPVTLKAAGEAPGYLPGYPRYVRSVHYGPINFENTFVSAFAGTTVSGNADGHRSQATFSSPSGICSDSAGNLYVLDDGNGLVRKISVSGEVTTIASGIGHNARGICVDPQGNVYVADPWNCNRILKIAPDLATSVFADVTQCRPFYAPPFRIGSMAFGPDGLCVGADRALLRVTESAVTTLVSGSEQGGWGWTVAPAVDAANNIFLATGASVRRLSGQSAILLAGRRDTLEDGATSTAGFSELLAIAAAPAGDLLVGEFMRVRRIRDGVVSTVAGSNTAYNESRYRNGPGRIALMTVSGLCVDADGIIYVADPANNCIRKIEPDTAGVGLPDAWQLARFGRVGVEPAADPDNDGISTADEYWAGTDPNAGTSNLSIELAVSTTREGTLELRWRTAHGTRYRAQFSHNLRDWTDLGAAVWGDGSVATVLDPSTSYRNAHWFYRVVVVDP